jgi:hypothetical protein
MPAYAHDAGVSSSEISVNGRVVAVEINALARDFEKAAGVRFQRRDQAGQCGRPPLWPRGAGLRA